MAGTILPEGKGVEGAACHQEQLKLFAYMLAQDHTLISASQTQHWHTSHMMTLKSPWASGTASVWEALFCVLTPVISHLASLQVEEIQGMQQTLFPFSRIWQKAY